MEVESDVVPQAERAGDNVPRLKPTAVDPTTEDATTQRHRRAASVNRTDAGAAELFAKELGDFVRYDHSRRRWLVWDDHRWKPDDDASVHRLALWVARVARVAAGDSEIALDDDQRKRMFAWALDLEKRPRHEAMLALARTMKPVADNGQGWDSLTGLIGVPNGVVDLRTGELRDGRRDDRITKQAGVEYDADATCPRWDAFLREILDDDDTIEYVQRLAGYSLTGEASEDKVAFLMGVGGNGKTTMLNVLRTIAGEYAQEVSASALLDERAAAHTTEVADLEGSRMATCEEIGDAKLNANRLKQISGGSPITARRMKQDTRTFAPTWQLWITTNGMPHANDNARSFWRRVVAIDFPNVFNPSDEPDLEAKLDAELPGILAWVVRGAVAFYANGLGEMPAAVAAHTAAYREDSDPLQPVFEAGYLVADEDAFTPVALLHGAYLRWADAAGVPTGFRLGSKGFSQSLSSRFDPDRKTVAGKVARVFIGVKVGDGK
jgi:putative DNA primase/helicase